MTTQTTILALASSHASSASVAVNSGANVRLGLFVGLESPVNAAFSTATSGGTLAAGTYYYRVSATNDKGESLASAETSQTTSGSTSTVTVNWSKVAGATGYKVYGRATGAQQLLATVGDVATWTDTGANTPSGALPTSNTSGRSLPARAQAAVFAVTPAADTLIGVLNQAIPVLQFSGPGTFRVVRTPGVTVGVYSET